MKGLWKVIAPFAPDQSGASAVLYELGGILVICDAGGCTGNICGFDEPRWFTRKSAVFSAGLRDMDAILGRDEKLVEKLCAAASRLDASFAAVIGTPVPAVIATDYKALRRMAEKKLDIPVITIDTDGMELYDRGASKAYLALFETFADDDPRTIPNAAGVIGATPLDTSSLTAGSDISEVLKQEGFDTVFCYGMGSGLDDIRQAGAAAKNFVTAPSGLAAAQMLQSRFGTPYEIRYPVLPAEIRNRYPSFSGKKILIVHQQVIAHTIREEAEKACAGRTLPQITAASWFMMADELIRDGDASLAEEDDFIRLVRNGQYDIIIGDSLLKRAVPEFTGEFIDLPHFAVSGRM